ncbi:MAG: non-hydrolyzing UDP-N-acetylglucosamine 2-epimerase, partial [bacterium]
MKIITIIGARPQFIKAATVSRAISEHNQANRKPMILEKIIHTGQHYDTNMSDVFFSQLQIPKPDYHLGISGGSHGQMTGRMLENIETELLSNQPDLVLVYGDTNSTLAGALAARKLNIPVAHVEAGLRSSNMQMPEEINRILTDRISDYLFCPTDTAMSNLRKEGFEHFDCQTIKTGDVMYDAALYYRQYAKKPRHRDIPDKDFILCTLHRAKNTDLRENLFCIFQAIDKISTTALVILPLHPRTRSAIKKYNIHLSPKIRTIEPVGYLEMLWHLNHCSLVMTDSGGLQKEAYFFGKPCVTLREETEWVELLESGRNQICGSDKSAIVAAVHDVLGQEFVPEGIYGDGKASQKIVKALIDGWE